MRKLMHLLLIFKLKFRSKTRLLVCNMSTLNKVATQSLDYSVLHLVRINEYEFIGATIADYTASRPAKFPPGLYKYNIMANE